MPACQYPEVYVKANRILRTLYGPNAAFRAGQYEAIEAAMTKKRTLVVQRTGWGKSLVYFICTRLLREQHKGTTFVVSPLLVLMENQLEAARRLGLRCDVLNSTVKDRREDILREIEADRLDLVLVTPETLFSGDIQQRFRNIRIGLLVIDEAHCISDWGHDFRLEYGNLRKIVGQLPENVPILATTATANNRVIADLKEQLGNDVFVSRGPLSRESLYLQVLYKPDRVQRYAWLLENVPKLPGSGIIYCLTQRDCDYLAEFLQKNHISAAAYYSRSGEEGAARNRQIEEQFREDQLKVIVATVKLGMGYDKGNIAFVIHYQMPANIVSYYQQIGRAGRNIPKAYIFLMYGKEDEEILNYFIETAFPSEKETDRIMAFIGANDGVKLTQILEQNNMRRARVEKALAFLENDGFIRREKGTYYITPKRYRYDRERYEAITEMRRQEIRQMKGLVSTSMCYSQYITTCLDDAASHPCGHCSNCLGKELMPSEVPEVALQKAEAYVNGLTLTIEPRKQWADRKKITLCNQPGLCLSKYGDAGYGELVKQGKYSREERFRDELVGKSAQMLRPWMEGKNITTLCWVPSLRSGIVKDFALRLASNLGLKAEEWLQKSEAQQQKKMENSVYQCENARRSFSVRAGARVGGNVLLVDDIVDSRWTLTVCGHCLMEAGAENVYPFTLADSSNRED